MKISNPPVTLNIIRAEGTRYAFQRRVLFRTDRIDDVTYDAITIALGRTLSPFFREVLKCFR